MRISQLETVAAAGGRIALWGWGREGRAAWRAIRSRYPHLPLTLFCTPDEAADALALGDAALVIETCNMGGGDANPAMPAQGPGTDAGSAMPSPTTVADAPSLAQFAVVIKSPGLSPYGPEAKRAAARGTQFIGGTALWFAEHPQARTVCVTGTKGKSTTSALIAHLLRAAGHRTALAGNIGLPLLELLQPPVEPEFWVIELSSFQTRDVALSGVHPEVAVVLNVYAEHLDWHGSEANYAGDKLALINEAAPRVAVLGAGASHALLQVPATTQVRRFDDPQGWHLREAWLYRGDQRVLDTASLPLPGRHNLINLCAALTAVDALGLDAAALAPQVVSFRPLPNRLQVLGEHAGMLYVNDSISTTPHASLAALGCFPGRRIALLLGGYDRGVSWDEVARRIVDDPPAAVITMGANGPRIQAALQAARDARAGGDDMAAACGDDTRTGFHLEAASDLPDAMDRARRVLAGQGVLLLSPGAPSFGPYRDYVARGRHFAELAGFDPDAISAIAGLGIA